ncbi:hypothetical protein [Tumebacillus permanentifrigoris]|uniref:MecA-like transpeptidase family protein n=1 Tax=Tumebacillus permanentifrigoris TaxID=378543 RepID=A0A316D8N0_9BACL|nr:hypothetical protein [Tumebacillus permanentifrigoris]PWK12830.1 hypothetical protein C7459_109192 [Tumebacillus permanentifrigoris]
MKRSQKILSAVGLAGILAVGLAWGGSVYASQEELKSAKKAAQEYVVAFEQHDVDAMIKYIKDARVKNNTELRASFEEFVKHDKEDDTKLKLVDVVPVSDGVFEAKFEEKSKRYNSVQFSLPIVNENNQWKIYVDGNQVVNTQN